MDHTARYRLRDTVLRKLEEETGFRITAGGRGVSRLGPHTLNVRAASRKAGQKFWFDVTPSFYENRRVTFFVYACGSPDDLFVIPVSEMPKLIEGASPGGSKQVPNFTVYLNSLELEPAGLAPMRHDIRHFHNAFDQLRAV